MQPVRSSPPSSPKPTDDLPKIQPEQKPTAYVATSEEKELAQVKHELFSAGVTAGGVLPVVTVVQPEEVTIEQKINQCTKEILDPVLQAIGKIEGAQLEAVTEERSAVVSAYIGKVPSEQAALYCHFSNMVMLHLMGLLSILAPTVRPRFLVLVQETLQVTMADAVEKIRTISPEFLVDVQLAMCKPKLDQHVSELAKVDRAELQSFRDNLEQKIVDEALSKSEPVKNAARFIDSVSRETKDVIIHCFIKGIDPLLKK